MLPGYDLQQEVVDFLTHDVRLDSLPPVEATIGSLLIAKKAVLRVAQIGLDHIEFGLVGGLTEYIPPLSGIITQKSNLFTMLGLDLVKWAVIQPGMTYKAVSTVLGDSGDYYGLFFVGDVSLEYGRKSSVVASLRWTRLINGTAPRHQTTYDEVRPFAWLEDHVTGAASHGIRIWRKHVKDHGASEKHGGLSAAACPRCGQYTLDLLMSVTSPIDSLYCHACNEVVQVFEPRR